MFWLGDVLLQSLRPHFLCRFTTGNTPADRQNPIASVVSGYSKKKTFLLFEDKIFDELSASSRLFDFSVATEFADFPTFAWRTIPRRFLRKENIKTTLILTETETDV